MLTSFHSALEDAVQAVGEEMRQPSHPAVNAVNVSTNLPGKMCRLHVSISVDAVQQHWWRLCSTAVIHNQAGYFVWLATSVTTFSQNICSIGLIGLTGIGETVVYGKSKPI